MSIELPSDLLPPPTLELGTVLDRIDQVVWYIDQTTLTLKYVNNAVEAIFGYTSADFCENPTLWQQRIHPDDRGLVRSFFETLHQGESQEIRFRIHRPSGELRWLNSRIHHDAELHCFIGITTDITELKTQGEEIAFLAYHDPLTMLPNRVKLKLQISSRIEHFITQPFSLILLDLDNFKNINDTMGHEIGDQILVEVARHLREAVGELHFLSRFGGDEFMILVATSDPIYISQFCTQLIQTFKSPFIINDLPFFLTSSVGIACYPDDARTPEDLIKHADTAMYEAKKNGKNQFLYYHSSMQRAIHNFLHIEALVRDGLRQEWFQLYFQPLIDSRTQTLQGFEALLRLPHPTEGFITPDAFIGVAENNGDILHLAQVVLKQACDFIEILQKILMEPFYVAINVSAKQLHQEGFAHEMLAYLAERNISAHYLKVELTESAVMGNIEIASHQLHTLKNGGIRISLDDFGTGYSSFAYLAQLPIDTLKIDKSFVQSLHHNESNRHIVVAISNLAHALGMNVTAEGVEDEDQFNFLIENRIDTLQGYLLSRPITKETIIETLTSNTPYFVPQHSLGYAI